MIAVGGQAQGRRTGNHQHCNKNRQLLQRPDPDNRKLTRPGRHQSDAITAGNRKYPRHSDPPASGDKCFRPGHPIRWDGAWYTNAAHMGNSPPPPWLRQAHAAADHLLPPTFFPPNASPGQHGLVWPLLLPHQDKRGPANLAAHLIRMCCPRNTEDVSTSAPSRPHRAALLCLELAPSACGWPGGLPRCVSDDISTSPGSPRMVVTHSTDGEVFYGFLRNPVHVITRIVDVMPRADGYQGILC